MVVFHALPAGNHQKFPAGIPQLISCFSPGQKQEIIRQKMWFLACSQRFRATPDGRLASEVIIMGIMK